MKTAAAFLMALYLIFGGWQAHLHAQARVETATQGSLVLKWLGTAGWEIRIGETIILIDPFLTRGEANPGAEWKTDEAAVLGVIKRADYIFAGHSHADHIADVPFIAKKFGSKVIGSRTTTNIALTGGVDKSQLVTITGGENLDFKDFTVQVIESVHGVLVRRGRKTRPKFEEITKPWSGPIMGDAFVEGGSYIYLFTFAKHRLLHQDTGGFIEEKLAGFKADTALLYPMERNDLSEVLKLLQPKTVFVHHFDRQGLPFSDGVPEQVLGRTRRFARDVAAIDKNIKVVVPKYFETYTLE
ncbi:MAG TPA: MBL fold metallo-hydrolase [Terriglobales bacterium]|nr:MBL fold metallo-hydrolase [Terriglobales bacterium]